MEALASPSKLSVIRPMATHQHKARILSPNAHVVPPSCRLWDLLASMVARPMNPWHYTGQVLVL